MLILPAQYDSASSYELLREAARGRVGLDQRLLKSLTARPDETLAALEKFAAEYHDDGIVDLDEQIFDLFRHFRSPRAIPYYVTLIKRYAPELSDDLMEALREQGAAALEPLIQVYRELGPDDGADIPFLLASIGLHDPRITAILLETLQRDPFEGALALGLYRDPSTRSQIEAALSEVSSSEERTALESCLKDIDEPAETEPARPFDLFDVYPETAMPPLEALPDQDCLDFLNCDSPEYREAAAISLCDHEYSHDIRAALLRRATSDDVAAVRGACWRALGEESMDESVRDKMLERLRDGSTPFEERAGALVGLAFHTRLREVHEKILEFYAAPETKPTALQAMWRSLDPRYPPKFAACVSETDPEIRRQVLSGIGAYPIPELALHLPPLFDDEEFREEALFAYALAAPGKTTKRSAEELFQRVENIAGGLTSGEQELLGTALDIRLQRAGLPARFYPDEDELPPLPAAAPEKTGRNEPCPCGSGKKYKKCCGA